MAKEPKADAKEAPEAAKTEELKDSNVCGLVMPISDTEGYPSGHWRDVRQIIETAIEKADLRSQMVSEADESGVIHDRIIRNLYYNPIVVCDISSRNPNVMLELGVRLAFDKPTVIVKDDDTPYPFDTTPIEYIEYPRALRFQKIIAFRESLTAKIKGTLKMFKSDPKYTPFLGHFGGYKVIPLERKELSKSDYIMTELRDLRKDLRRVVTEVRKLSIPPNHSRLESRAGIADRYGSVDDLDDIVKRVLFSPSSHIDPYSGFEEVDPEEGCEHSSHGDSA